MRKLRKADIMHKDAGIFKKEIGVLESDNDRILASIGKFVLYTLLFLSIIIPYTIVRGFVVSILWGWFITPFGLPAISLPLAIGLSLTIGYITSKTADNHKDDRETDWTKFTANLIGPLVVLTLGYVVHLYL